MDKQTEQEKIKRLQECASDAEAELEQKKLMTELALLLERERIEELQSNWGSEEK
ncbi:hypothetical protein JCM9140_3844 [Halalkalibacter wakoensis JCM 9140]|uniref:Uncharacterized protein n=1 Tax=Halalkalibacter wakoensis JCM 9140 TaxID=1236970 RepID=W4Q7K3_9BACI|nr:hypothetical protein [Halalkalibacter wakoensis]GAE27688.1 hypothetical protein JCM9140_3844 [Halalkalibacter wakoensis JCM 9140]